MTALYLALVPIALLVALSARQHDNHEQSLPGFSRNVDQLQLTAGAENHILLRDALVSMAVGDKLPFNGHQATTGDFQTYISEAYEPNAAVRHIIKRPFVVVYRDEQNIAMGYELARLDGSGIPGEPGSGSAGWVGVEGGRRVLLTPGFGPRTDIDLDALGLPAHVPVGAPVVVTRLP